MSGAATTRQEAQPDRPLGVVGVGVEQADRLPRPERRAAVDDRDRQRRRRQQRQDMVGTVARRPVAMAVQPVLAWQQPVEGVHEVVVRARSDLDHDEPGRRMRHEHGQQAVPGVDVARGTRRPPASGRPDLRGRTPSGPISSRVPSPTGRCSAGRRGCGPGHPSRAPTRSASARRRRASWRPTGAARRSCCSAGVSSVSTSPPMPLGAATRTGISRTSRPSSAIPDSCAAPPVRITPAGQLADAGSADLVAQQLERLAHPRLDDLAHLEPADGPTGVLAEDADADLLVVGHRPQVAVPFWIFSSSAVWSDVLSRSRRCRW